MDISKYMALSYKSIRNVPWLQKKEYLYHPGNYHENLHQRTIMMSSPMAPKGAYCRSIAFILICRAAFLYFSESALSEVDS
jgi:hypothetical protein